MQLFCAFFFLTLLKEIFKNIHVLTILFLLIQHWPSLRWVLMGVRLSNFWTHCRRNRTGGRRSPSSGETRKRSVSLVLFSWLSKSFRPHTDYTVVFCWLNWGSFKFCLMSICPLSFSLSLNFSHFLLNVKKSVNDYRTKFNHTAIVCKVSIEECIGENIRIFSQELDKCKIKFEKFKDKSFKDKSKK